MRLTHLLGFAALFVAMNFKDVEAKMSLPQIQNAMKPFNKACIPKSGVDKDILENTRNGEFPPDRNLQCHHACLLGKMKVLTKDNKISLDSITKQLDIMVEEELLAPMKTSIDKCYVAANSDEVCEMSWQFIKCYYETNPELYFFP